MNPLPQAEGGLRRVRSSGGRQELPGGPTQGVRTHGRAGDRQVIP